MATKTPQAQTERDAFEGQFARESGLVDSNGFFIEDYFVQLVAYERKKTERSQAPFLLMLLRLEDKFYVQETNDFVTHLGAALTAGRRAPPARGSSPMRGLYERLP